MSCLPGHRRQHAALGCDMQFSAAALGRLPRATQEESEQEQLFTGVAFEGANVYRPVFIPELISIDKQLRFPLVSTLS